MLKTTQIQADHSSSYARIDFKTPQKGEVPVEITINKETKPAGKVSFTGISDGNPKLLTKTSWVQ